jgi:lysophospholipase L1-like esterase
MLLRPVAAICVALAVVLTGCGSSSTGSGEVASGAPIGRYVALGDSYSAGPGIPTTSFATGCRRSDHSYPVTLAAVLGAGHLADVACGGATIGDITGPQQTEGGEVPPQLDAVTPDTDLVTVSIGANDMRLIPMLLACATLALQDHDGAPCQEAYAARVGAHLPPLRAHLVALLQAIKDRAPDARLVVIGYPQLFDAGDQCSDIPLTSGDYAFAATTITQMNEQLRAAAARVGAPYVDVEAASAGHDLCSKEPWVNGPGRSHVAAQLHPFEREQDAITQLVQQALQ